MRNNQPVTQREVDYSPDIRMVSMTDLQGKYHLRESGLYPG